MLPILWHTTRFSKVIEDMGSEWTCGFRTEVFDSPGQLLTKLKTPLSKPDVVLMDYRESSICEINGGSLGIENVIWSLEPEFNDPQFEWRAHRAEADFITWPIHPRELRLRIGKILHRKERLLTSFANFLDHLGDDLTGKELRILRCFASAPEQALTRGELMRTFWPNKSVHPKTLDVQIFSLRKKLEAVEMEIRYRPASRDWQFISRKTQPFPFALEIEVTQK